MSTVLQYPQRHAVTAREYLRMGEMGVFAEDARLELIEGEIIEMAPIGPPHAGAVNALNRMLVRRASDHAVVAVQNPAVISDLSVPQPDLALLEPRADSYSDSHPSAAEMLLAVEVADTTLAFDLGKKASLYARCGVAELWVVDVNGRVIHVYRDPSASGYQTRVVAASKDRLECAALPEVSIVVAEVFSK